MRAAHVARFYLDDTRVVVGPTATLYLADCGADVIKIEAPGGDLHAQ